MIRRKPKRLRYRIKRVTRADDKTVYYSYVKRFFMWCGLRRSSDGFRSDDGTPHTKPLKKPFEFRERRDAEKLCDDHAAKRERDHQSRVGRRVTETFWETYIPVCYRVDPQ